MVGGSNLGPRGGGGRSWVLEGVSGLFSKKGVFDIYIYNIVNF